MELQTINQVSKEYGVSARMLRYYEKIGLIQSLRKEDYAYRVYDDIALPPNCKCKPMSGWKSTR
ncbi:MAG: hypothetical protein A2Y17_05020 [Clostridiales bacterium GWF2_38_85]|nr:MAG: hypothetical protein A2Y17_05020 [Clostridiales bacterium GWF2_38_85]